MPLYRAIGQGFQGQLAIRRGDAKTRDMERWASRYCVRLQESAGLEVIWDGEQQRSEMYAWAIAHANGFEPRGTVALKGKAEPVPVYRLIGVEEQPRPARGLEAHGLKAALLGRDDELAHMLAAFDRTLHGRAQMLSLIGEAGAGKSRLVEEFVARLHVHPGVESLTIRRAACSSLVGAISKPALPEEVQTQASGDPARRLKTSMRSATMKAE